MLGFLARAGHLLGRVAVSLGYGGVHSLYDDPHPKIAVCFRAEIAEPTLETQPMAATSCLETEIDAIALTTSPMEAMIVLTEFHTPEVGTKPAGAVTMTTEIDEC